MEDKKCAPGKDYKDGTCFTINNSKNRYQYNYKINQLTKEGKSF